MKNSTQQIIALIAVAIMITLCGNVFSQQQPPTPIDPWVVAHPKATLQTITTGCVINPTFISIPVSFCDPGFYIDPSTGQASYTLQLTNFDLAAIGGTNCPYICYDPLQIYSTTFGTFQPTISYPVPTGNTTANIFATFPDIYHKYTVTIGYVNSNTGCTGGITFDIEPCCSYSASYPTFVNTGSASQALLGAYNNTGPYNWGATSQTVPFGNGTECLVTTKTILIEGTFVVDANMHFDGCQLLMKPGAEIIVVNGNRLTLTGGGSGTCDIQAACNRMWKGITVLDGGALFTQGPPGAGSGFNHFMDAQYLFRFNGDATYAFNGYVASVNNYVTIYCPPYTSLHHLTPIIGGGASGNSQWFHVYGTASTYIYALARPLLGPFPGQTPYTTTSDAAILLNDVDNFSFFNSDMVSQCPCANFYSTNCARQTSIYGCRYAINSLNSNLNLGNFLMALNNTGAIHAGAVPGQPWVHRSLSIDGASTCATSPALHTWFSQNTNYDIFAYAGMDVSVNSTQSDGNYKTQIYAYIPNRNLTVTNCTFHHGKYGITAVGIKRNSIVDIENNTFDTPTNANGNGFNNTCMRLYGLVGATSRTNVTVSNNTITDKRIGLYMNGILGSESHIDNNHFIIHRGVWDPANPGLLFGQNHIGYWFDHCSSLLLNNNEAANADGTPPANFWSTYQPQAIAFNIKTSGNIVAGEPIIIGTSPITSMGTAFRFVDDCEGVFLKCNGMHDCTKGVFFDYTNGSSLGAQLSSQGSSNMSSGNAWYSWNSAPFKIEGILLASNIINWYHTSNPIEDPTPYSVFPILNFNSQLTGGSAPCTAPIIDDGGRVERIGAIINDDVYYSIYPDESAERDKEYAYLQLKYDEALRNSDQQFIDYYNSHINSNFQKFDDVNNLIDNDQYTDALVLVNSITPTNEVQIKLQFALRIAIQTLIDPNFVIPQADVDQLETLAWTPVWQGGNAVFIARALLFEEVNDYGNGLRIGQNGKGKDESLSCNIYPNPAQDNISIAVTGIKEFEVRITDVTGQVIIKQKSNASYSDINVINLRPGLYFVEVYNDNVKIKSTKISKQ